MDLQTMLNNAVKAGRAETMANSDQLTLGELILKLETVKNKDLPVYFDETEYRPTGFCSWRGHYRELAITYTDGEANNCYDEPLPTCERDEFGDHHYECQCGKQDGHSTTLKNPTVSEFLDMLEFIKGRYFVGYKGGDFTMSRQTPVWVANDGMCSGFSETKEGYQGVVGVKEREDKVLILTADCES